MSVIIGLLGQIGAGKETFIKTFAEIVAPATVSHVSTSGFLKATLGAWNLPATRRNLQDLSIIMDKQYGEGTLSRAIHAKMQKDGNDYIAYDCIRWTCDIECVRSFQHSLIVYVTADARIRWQRKHINSEKVGEQGLSFEDFLAAERQATETSIAKLGQTADFTIVNNGGLEEFRAAIERFKTYYAAPLLERNRAKSP